MLHLHIILYKDTRPYMQRGTRWSLKISKLLRLLPFLRNVLCFVLKNKVFLLLKSIKYYIRNKTKFSTFISTFILVGTTTLSKVWLDFLCTNVQKLGGPYLRKYKLSYFLTENNIQG